MKLSFYLALVTTCLALFLLQPAVATNNGCQRVCVRVCVEGAYRGDEAAGGGKGWWGSDADPHADGTTVDDCTEDVSSRTTSAASKSTWADPTPSQPWLATTTQGEAVPTTSTVPPETTSAGEQRNTTTQRHSTTVSDVTTLGSTDMARSSMTTTIFTATRSFVDTLTFFPTPSDL